MPAQNTSRQYGAITKTFHWLTALGILAAIPLGILANDLPYDTAEQLSQKAFLFSVHKTVGITVFFVALARIAWALSQPKPAPLHPERRVETLLAEIVHWLLYGSLVLVPLSGWVHHAATEGFAPIWWPLGQNLPLVPESARVADIAAGLHIVFERVLVASLLLHVAGALKHALVDRDATLARMLPGRTDVEPQPEARHASVVPAVMAVAIWAMALGVSGMLGLYDKDGAQAAVAPALAEVDGDWAVTEGTVAIRILQMGSDVSGSFSTWTADITFDEAVEIGVAGRVAVEIAIASLTLGSVTQQAIGADYFAAATYPTARFEADLLRTEDGYVAEGHIMLRGVERPVSLPFTMDLDGDIARVHGETVLDRRAFDIGAAMTDEGQLGFDVQVAVDLTAVRDN